jgi:hypothetical protein
MTIIKNHFEVFIVISKKAGKCHYRVKRWVIFNKGQFTQSYLSVKCQLWSIVLKTFSFIIPQVIQIMSIIFQTGHELSIVLGNESTSASARVRFASTIE